MTHFYFDLYDGGTATRDAFGIDLGSIDEAADQAAALLSDIAVDHLAGESSRDFATFVRDDRGSLVYRAALLYRAQALDGSAAPAPPSVHGDDLITQSRQIRETTRQIATRLDRNVHDLLGAIMRAAGAYEESAAILGRS